MPIEQLPPGAVELTDRIDGMADGARERRKIKTIGLAGVNGATGAARYTVPYWLGRELQPPDFLLGDLISTTSRLLFVGPTGLGKTNFALALAFAIATGSAFLHWQPRRSARAVYFDGEMSSRLVRDRLRSAAERHSAEPKDLIVINRDDFANMPPLNTPEGQQFADRIIADVNAEIVFFDNIQALLAGDMKEEQPWSDALPWIRDLTRRRIGQVWVHHTGHNQTRSYGTKTREWQFDTVALLGEKAEEHNRLVYFSLEFTKARERTPSNRGDFAPADIWIADDDRWHSSSMPARKGKIKRPSPMGEKFYEALVDAINVMGQRGLPFAEAPSAVTRIQWRDTAIRRGLIDECASANLKSAKMSKYQTELIAANWVAVAGDFAWLIKTASDAGTG